MTQPSIAAQIHQALNIHSDFTAEISLNQIVSINSLTDLKNLLICQLVNSTIKRNSNLLNNLSSFFRANTMNILKSDDNTLVCRNIYTSYTSHSSLHI